MNSINVGIIGIGNMGSAHAFCIAKGGVEGMNLVAVCDISESKCSGIKAQYPHISVYSDYKEMLENPEIDAVIIAVPHPLHADIAIDALKAGKHILVEKPIDIAVSKAKMLNEFAKTSGKVFAIMFNQRTNELFEKARDIVKSGELGELQRTVWIVTNWYRTQKYYDSGDWRATWKGEGGGVLLNQAPHQLDLWQWICGMPQSVTAFCDVAHYHNIEVEDNATIFTRYKNGATGAFITTTGEFPGTNRLEISGTMGKIVIENDTLKWWKLKISSKEFSQNPSEEYNEIPCEYTQIKPKGKESAHRGILQNFTNAILNGEELISPGYDGINELTLSNAAYLSCWKGNKEISLPFEMEEFDSQLSERIKTSKYTEKITSSKTVTEYEPRWQVKW